MKPVRVPILSCLGVAFAFGAFSAPANGQRRPAALDAGARVRFQLAGEPRNWRVGELDAVRGDSLVVFADGRTVTFATHRIARIETPWRDKRGALTGAAIGAGVAIALAGGMAGAASSDAAGFAVLGAAIGAGIGSGARTRRAAALGAAVGAALGAVSFGPSGTACESGADPPCDYIVGGVFGAITGLTIGTAIGMLGPNWVRVPLDGLTIRMGGPDAALGIGWTARW